MSSPDGRGSWRWVADGGSLELPNVLNASSEEQFVCLGSEAIVRSILEEVEERAGGWILIGLSGGKTPIEIFTQMATKLEISVEPDILERRSGRSFVDWSRVIFFLIDERYVPLDHEHNNAAAVKACLEPLLRKGASFIYPDTSISPISECVEDYDCKLSKYLYTNRVCLAHLGLGEDGHIASWFPPLSQTSMLEAFDPLKLVCHSQQENRGLVIKDRITVSLHVILSAKKKVFFLKGANKLEVYENFLGTSLTRQTILKQPFLQTLKSKNVSLVVYPPFTGKNQKDSWNSTTEISEQTSLAVIVFGATGDLAQRKTIPALFHLYASGHLPRHTKIVCVSRKKLAQEKFDRIVKDAKNQRKINKMNILGKFKSLFIFHECRSYSDVESFREMSASLTETFESNYKVNNRLLYLALPPDIFPEAIQAYCSAVGREIFLPSERYGRRGSTSRSSLLENESSPDSPSNKLQAVVGWTRVVVEKPFGRDSGSSSVLAKHLSSFLKEKEIYRIDHYLGKEMVLNLLILRFANVFIAPLWNRNYVKAVRITFKESIGTKGRGGYFDNYGIIRDVMQNHLLQLLSLVAMERPVSLNDERVRDEKVKVLRCISPAVLENTVLGQYTRGYSPEPMEDGTTVEIPGYLEDDTIVNKDSKCPTFATIGIFINNERWQGVPFILKAGKALETQLAEIRIQLDAVVASQLFGKHHSDESIEECALPPNEIVLRIQPNEAIYVKCIGKKPGLDSTELVETELDLSVMERFNLTHVHDAYERLILDVIRGDKKNFVRDDELQEAWRIMTPLLQRIDAEKVEPEHYAAGSRGPESSYNLISKLGFMRSEGYKWTRRTSVQ